MNPTTVVLVHGMCGSPAAWSRVIPLLDALDVRSVAVHLPSCIPDSKASDASAMRSFLDEHGGEGGVVLVGHSYGGMVLTEAGDHRSVAHLVYLDAEMLDVGESLFEVVESGFNERFSACMKVHDSGETSAFDPDCLTAYFVSRGWSDEDVRDVLPGLCPQRFDALVTVPTVAAWRTVPSTFISCTESEMSGDLQGLFASRATGVIEIPGDHFPLWRRPDEVAEILFRVAVDVAAR
jgi:pimeloyl-ACP methyl ester carboxylesterase